MEFENRQVELAYRQKRLQEERAKSSVPIPVLRRAFNAIAGTAAGFWQTRALWMDFSDWEPVIDFSLFEKIDGVMVKLFEVDDTTNPAGWIQKGKNDIIYAAQRYNKPCVGYMYNNTAYWPKNGFTAVSVNNLFDNEPTNDLKMKSLIDHDPQFKSLLRSWALGSLYLEDITALRDGRVKFLPLAAIAIDVERSCWDYNDYYANPTTYRKVDDYWIMFSTKWFKEKLSWAMQHGYLPQVPINAPDDTPVYSGNWFIQQFGPVQFKTFLETCVSWVAGYYWSGAAVVTTIEEFKSKYLAQIPETWRPVLFGKARWLQITGDKFRIPQVKDTLGRMVGVDINVSLFTKEQDYAWLGFVPAPVPTPDPDPIPDPVWVERVVVRMLSDETNLRTQPSAVGTGSICGKVVKGQTLMYWEETRQVGADTWYRVTGTPAGSIPKSGECWVAGTVTQYSETKQYSKLVTILVKS